MEKENRKQKFIDSSSIVHKNKYDYSCVDYINTNFKVKILCPTHGEFEQLPKHHLGGSGCSKCSGNHKKNTNTFISEAINKHHNKYDYSLVNYKSIHGKVDIICDKHGVFKQTPSHHLNGSGCPKCGNDVISKEDFIIKAKLIHSDFYEYSKVNFISTKKKVKILCPVHGEFEQTPYHHYNGSGCSMCRESKGEREIRKYLIDNGISFLPQHRFPDCKDKRSLPFDFYLPEHNTCIEFDGEQHFKVKELWGGKAGLLDRQNKDSIKTEYCKNNNIKLIRVTDIKNFKYVN